MHRDEHESQHRLEDGSRLLPRSPQSLSQSKSCSDQHAITTDTSERAHPSTLHLKKVTWESLNEIDFPPDENFDIVDGLLVWVPMAHGTTMHQRVIKGLVQLINQLLVWSAVCGLDVEAESSNNKRAPAVNRRGPDVVVTRYDSPASSESPPSPSRMRKQKHVLRTKDKPPFAVLEVTSESTRDTDITIKWSQYRRTGIKFYYIIDLHVFELSGQALVIVGSKDAFEGALRCHHGSPGAPPPDWTPESCSDDTFYYKKVYSGDQQVDVGIFCDSKITASQLMDPTFLKKKVKEIRQHNANLNQTVSDLTREVAHCPARNAGLKESNRSLNQKVSDLAKHNALLIQQLNEVCAKRTSGHASSSNSSTKPKMNPQKGRPTSPSRKQSTESPPKSPTNSPKKKRPKTH